MLIGELHTLFAMNIDRINTLAVHITQSKKRISCAVIQPYIPYRHLSQLIRNMSGNSKILPSAIANDEGGSTLVPYKLCRFSPVEDVAISTKCLAKEPSYENRFDLLSDDEEEDLFSLATCD